MSFYLLLALGLCPASACEPTPCDALVEEWMACYCDGATPTTTLPESYIEEACTSPSAFAERVPPAAERDSLERCDEPDRAWADKRLAHSECRAGGAFVCGGQEGLDHCLPPE